MDFDAKYGLWLVAIVGVFILIGLCIDQFNKPEETAWVQVSVPLNLDHSLEPGQYTLSFYIKTAKKPEVNPRMFQLTNKSPETYNSLLYDGNTWDTPHIINLDSIPK